MLITAILLIGAVIGIGVSAETAEATPAVRIAGQNIAYEGAVQVLYLVETKNDAGYTPKLLISDKAFEVDGTIPEGVTVKECPTDAEGNPLTVQANGKTYFALFSNGIGPKNMRVAIYATPVLVAEDGSVVAGKQVVYSPWQYSINRFDKNPTEAQMALYTAMLDYAGAVQDVTMTEEEVLAAGGWADAYYRAAVDYKSAKGVEKKINVTDWMRDPFTYEAEAKLIYNEQLFIGFAAEQQAAYADYRYYDLEVVAPGTTSVTACYEYTKNDLPSVVDTMEEITYAGALNTSDTKGTNVTEILIDENGDPYIHTKKNRTGASMTVGATATDTTGEYFVFEFDMENLTNGGSSGQLIRAHLDFLLNGNTFSMSPFFGCSNAGVLTWKTHNSRRPTAVASDGTVTQGLSHYTMYKTLEGALSYDSTQVITTLDVNSADIKTVRFEIHNRGAQRTESFVYTDANGVEHNMTQKLYVPELYIYVNGKLFAVSVDTRESQYTATVTAGVDGAEDTVTLASTYDTAYAAGKVATFTRGYFIQLYDGKYGMDLSNLIVTARNYNETYEDKAEISASYSDWTDTGLTALKNSEFITMGTVQSYAEGTALYADAVEETSGGNTYFEFGRGNNSATSTVFQFPTRGTNIPKDEIFEYVAEFKFKIVGMSKNTNTTVPAKDWGIRIDIGGNSEATSVGRAILYCSYDTTTGSATALTYNGSTKLADLTPDENGISSSAWLDFKIVSNPHTQKSALYVNGQLIASSTSNGNCKGSYDNYGYITIETRGSAAKTTDIRLGVDDMKLTTVVEKPIVEANRGTGEHAGLGAVTYDDESGYTPGSTEASNIVFKNTEEVNGDMAFHLGKSSGSGSPTITVAPGQSAVDFENPVYYFETDFMYDYGTHTKTSDKWFSKMSFYNAAGAEITNVVMVGSANSVSIGANVTLERGKWYHLVFEYTPKQTDKGDGTYSYSGTFNIVVNGVRYNVDQNHQVKDNTTYGKAYIGIRANSISASIYLDNSYAGIKEAE